MNLRANLKACVVMSVFLLGMGCATAEGRTIYVDDDGAAEFDNIQAAIDDSNDGDTIIVRDGTYTGGGNRDIDFLGKAITVSSENGPQKCIIDCQGTEAEPHRGFYFHSGEDSNSILNGFTIKNGVEWQGGGIRCTSSSPTINNCVIRNNKVVTSGMILGEGGAILCEASKMTLSNCRFLNNTSSGPGGAICSYSYRGTGNISVINCLFSGNQSGTKGGAIYSQKDNISLHNCVISNNNAVMFGGGVVCLRITPTIRNCTITSNSAGERGGGIYCRAGDTAVINTILWGNSAPIGQEIKLNSSGSTSLTISYSDVQGGVSSVSVDSGCMLNWEIGNVIVDPLFSDAASGDYHLKSQAGRWDPNSESWVTDSNTSPCIDAGNPGCPLGDEPNDPNNIRINMGAYGGTAEASKSPANWALLADLTNDRIVDFDDLAVFVRYWLDIGECVPSDLTRNQSVDFADFALMALHWLECTGPECGVQVTDVKIIRCELTEDGFQEIEEVDEVLVGDIFIVEIEVSNFGSETKYIPNLYGWDLSPENCVEVIGIPICCLTYYELQPGESTVLSPFCPSQAFRAQQDGRVTMSVQVNDWYSLLCEHTFTFEVLPEE